MSNRTAQADLNKGLRLIDEELFPASDGAVTANGQHIADLAMIDAKNVLPTINGYTSFFGVDQKLTTTDLPTTSGVQEIFGYRSLYGNALLIALCSDGLYIRSLAGAAIAVVTDVPSDSIGPDRFTIDLPDGKGSWIKVLSPIIGLLSPWKLWTYTILQNHLYVYAKGFDRIFKLTSYEADQVIFEKINPTYIIGTSKAYEAIVHSEDNSDNTGYKQIIINQSDSLVRGKIKVPMTSALEVFNAPDEFVARLQDVGIAANYVMNSQTVTNITASIALTGVSLGIVLTHDGDSTDFNYSIAEAGGNTTITIGSSFRTNQLSTMTAKINDCPTGVALVVSHNNDGLGSDNLLVHTISNMGVVTERLNIEYNGGGAYYIASNTDLSTIIFSVEQELSSNDPRLYISVNSGTSWALVTDAAMNARMVWTYQGRGLLWDGTYFWHVFSGSGTYEMWRSVDGLTWTDMTSSLTGDISSNIWNDIAEFTYVNGNYYMSGHSSSGGQRDTCILWSTNCLIWNKLDDTIIADFTSQSNNSAHFKAIGSEVAVLTPPAETNYTFKHIGSGNVLTRVSASDATTYDTVIAKGNNIFSYGSTGWRKSTDLGDTWAIHAAAGASVPNPDSNIGFGEQWNAVAIGTGWIVIDQSENLWHSLDGITWTNLGDMYAAFSYVGTVRATQIILSPTFFVDSGATALGSQIYDVVIEPGEDSNELVAAIVTALSNASCTSPVANITTLAKTVQDWDLTFNFPMIDPVIDVTLALSDTTATVFTETSLTSLSVALAHMEGITSAKNRLVAWDVDNLIYWSSAQDYSSFTPSAETRANQISVTSILGKILKCEGYPNGFIIYSTGNIVQGAYTGGTHTYKFNPIKGSTGVIDPRHIKASTTNHYIWTNLGLEQVNPDAAKVEALSPELTDWLHNYRYPITLGLLANRFLVIYLQDRPTRFSNKHLRNGDSTPTVSLRPIAKTKLDINPARSGLNLYTTYTRALLFDTVLGRWGTADLAHKLLIALDPINQIGYKVEKDYTLQSANLANMQKGLGVLEFDNGLALADSYPSDSYLVFGKYSVHRTKLTKLTEVISEFINYPNATVEIEKSIDGAIIDIIQTDTSPAITTLRSLWGPNISGQWLNIVVRGHYRLKRLLVKGHSYGRR